jgi:hypothetical protein
MKNTVKILSLALVAAVPVTLLINSSLSSTMTYCVNDSPLIAYRCIPKYKVAEGLSEEVKNNFEYSVDDSKFPDSFMIGKSGDPTPWQVEVLEGSFFTELFGQCSEPKKCALVKLDVWRYSNKKFTSERDKKEGFYHYIVLVKNGNGKLEKTDESFAASGRKG